MSSINYIAFSTRNPSKHKCGDASFAGAIEISGEKVVLLLVADGVSKSPKDWLASLSAVDFIVEEIKQSKKPISEAMKAAIETANSKICAGVENTFGMLTTLSAVVYHPADEKLYWCNVGDSRILGWKNNEWHQLSTDDSTSMQYKENGKIKLQNGAPIMLSALTKAIGQDSALTININETAANEYKALALASDGFYDLTGFNHYASELAASADMEKKAAGIQSDIVSQIRDDASIAIIRLPGKRDFDLRSYLMEQNHSAIEPVDTLEVLEQEIKQAALNQDHEYLEKIIAFMKSNRLFYSKPKMIELLEHLIAHKSPMVHEMTLLIRKI
ncbi:MAG: protein phosphatase 2C domain-containing protein [Bacteroidales bacterium]|nr:protein phosphatase 2C domain-containing protein [Bacteroidales bacterium]